MKKSDLNMIKELLSMGFSNADIVEMFKSNGTPEVAKAETTDQPLVNDHAVRQDINITWDTKNLSVTFTAVNSTRVHKDLWSVNFEILKSLGANYSKSKGIYWYKKDSELFTKAKSEFKPVTCLDVEAQIELEHKRIKDYNGKIESLQALIKESEAKLDKLKAL